MVRGRRAVGIRAGDQGVLRAADGSRPARAHRLARRAASAPALRAGRSARDQAARAAAGRRVQRAAASRRALVTGVDYDRRLYRTYRAGRSLSADTGRLWMAEGLARMRGAVARERTPSPVLEKIDLLSFRRSER